MNDNQRIQPSTLPVNLNTMLCTNGFANQSPTRFLIDSGAAVSVVRLTSLSDDDRKVINKTESSAVSANGTPLDVKGEIKLMVSMGSFTCEHTFIVICDLAVDYLLGADVLKKYEAIIDCKSSKLALGAHVIPIYTEQQTRPLSTYFVEKIPVTVIYTQEIPGQTVQLVTCNVRELNYFVNSGEGLIEPSDVSGSVPRYLCVAQSLATVDPDNRVTLQIMNISPNPIKVYRGMKLGQIIPRDSILIVEQSDMKACDNDPYIPDVNLDSSSLSPLERAKLLDVLSEYSDIFAAVAALSTQTTVVKHAIKTRGPPIRQPLRRTPVALKDTIDKEVTKMLQQGIVQPSTSPWSSPVVMVRKRDGTWRFCVNYRKLNSITHQDAYPLPRINETLDSLAGSTYFTTLDLAAGYWQIQIDECDKEKTAFSTAKGHYEFNVMPFGLTNAPATFQRLIECVLAGLTGEQCLIYVSR